MAQLRVSGVTLASILYDVAMQGGEVEGFLLGSVSRESYTTLSDGAESTVHFRDVVEIRTFQPTGTNRTFYDAMGVLNESAFPDKGVVVGWLRARCADLRPTMRDIAVQRALVERLGGSHPVYYAMFALTKNVDESIHTNKYAFTTMSKGAQSLTPVALNITNMVEGSAAEYHAFQALSPFRTHVDVPTNAFDELVASLGPQGLIPLAGSTPPPHVVEQERFYASTLVKLQEMADKAHASNCRVRELEEELKRLRT